MIGNTVTYLLLQSVNKYLYSKYTSALRYHDQSIELDICRIINDAKTDSNDNNKKSDNT
jgi:hypothetical protein